MAEIIPLPNDRAMEKLPIHIEVQPESFPERFRVRFEWNYIAEKWTIEVEHVSIDRTVVNGFASPYLPYWYDPYILFVLIDPSGEEMEVTPENLGDSVRLFAFPGPAGQTEEEAN